MGFPRQGYWGGLPRSPPGDLPDSGIKPASPVSSALAGGFFTTEPPGKPRFFIDALYQTEKVPFNSRFAEHFIRDRC